MNTEPTPPADQPTPPPFPKPAPAPPPPPPRAPSAEAHREIQLDARRRAVDEALAAAAAQRHAFPQRTDRPVGRILDGMFLLKGIATVGTSLIVAVLGPLALHWSAEMAAKSNAALPAIVVPFVQRPWLLAVLAVPAVVCGVMMMATKRYRWVAITVSTVILLLVLGIILLVFTAGLKAMYGSAMQPL